MLAPAARVRTPELMDQPGLDQDAHRHALDSLGRACLISRTTASLWPSIRSAADTVGSSPVRILDLACGGGHLAVDLARQCADAGIHAEVLGCDVSPVALDYAGKLAAQRGVRGIRFARLNVLADPLPGGFDIVCCSLFLHHLADDEAEDMLRKMKAAAARLVAVSDLRRTNLGLLYTVVGCRLLSRSRVFHIDGARSVRAAFTTDEMRTLADRAGLLGARVANCWPQRLVLVYEIG